MEKRCSAAPLKVTAETNGWRGHRLITTGVGVCTGECICVHLGCADDFSESVCLCGESFCGTARGAEPLTDFLSHHLTDGCT